MLLLRSPAGLLRSIGAGAGLLVCSLIASQVASGCGSDGPSSEFADAGDIPEAAACADSKLQLCGASCVDTSTDPANCGGCGVACGGSEACCAAGCVETASCAFAVTSLQPARGMQNGGDWVLLKGSGFAKGMRVTVGGGRAPVLVLDATTARIQTPPGLPGAVDVTLTLAGATSTRKKSFRYDTAGVLPPWKSIPMAAVRGENPGITVLQDGRAMVAGGTTVPDQYNMSLASLEIFERDQEKMVPVAKAMGTPRWQNNAITLLDGKVLLVGGACADDGVTCTGDPTLAELFDPVTGNIVPTTGKLTKSRAYPRSVLVPDGRVLITSANDSSLDIYDPDTGSFTNVANTQRHEFGFAVRLRDGRVMFGGGDGGVTSVQLFDPDTNALTATAPLKQGRSMLTAHTLPDGRVAVIGGASLSAGAIDTPLASIELYDPTAGTFSDAPYKLTIGRTWHASALVRDGTILVMGGYTTKDCSSSVGSVDQVDVVKGTVTAFDGLPDAKRSTEWNAVTLLDGSIVAVGGGACGTTKALPEIYFLAGAPAPR